MMLHSVYTLINNIVRGRTLSGVRLLWTGIDESQAGLVKATLGIVRPLIPPPKVSLTNSDEQSRGMLELWGRAHSLIVRQREINTLLARQPQGLDELRWEAAELQNELDMLEVELSDDEGWHANWVRSEEAREIVFLPVPLGLVLITDLGSSSRSIGPSVLQGGRAHLHPQSGVWLAGEGRARAIVRQVSRQAHSGNSCVLFRPCRSRSADAEPDSQPSEAKSVCPGRCS